MKINAMLGYKLFKELDDGTLDLVRIVDIRKTNEPIKEVTIKNYGNNSVKKVKVETLKGYTPLEPDGLCTFNVVELEDGDGKTVKDVIVTGSKILNIRVGDTLPYCVCRQNITDIFYNLLCKDESDMITGLSINRDTCPANFDYGLMLACNKITYTDSVNFYRNDTLDDILSMVKKLKFDTVLSNLYAKHVEYCGNPSLMFKKHDGGWCKDLITLLHDNNFQEDINQMLGITSVDVDIEKYTVKSKLPDGEEYTTLDEEFKMWLSSIFKVNINDITVLEYNHDINLAEFNNASYFILRDKNNRLWLTVYTVAGQYHGSDLEAMLNKKDFSSEFRINFYNKYSNNNGNK